MLKSVAEIFKENLSQYVEIKREDIDTNSGSMLN